MNILYKTIMIYFKCPTCRTILANKEIIFEQEMEKICSKNLDKKDENKLKEELLNKLELKRYCCRQRVLTCSDLIKIIK